MAKYTTFDRVKDKIQEKSYIILILIILIILPNLQGIAGLPKIPILSDLYSTAVKTQLLGTNIYILSLVTLALIFGIFAASWDLLSGYTGQFNFGHAMFFGLSAYSFYIFYSAQKLYSEGIQVHPITYEIIKFLSLNFHMNIYTAFVLSAFSASLLAFFVGLVALRLKGAYFALITLILPLIIYQAILVIDLLPGKQFGLSFSQQRLISGYTLNSEPDVLHFYILTFIFFLLSIGIMLLVAYSRLGDLFMSIREDEEAAESLGVNITKYKILAFVISAFFAGVAGNLYGQWVNTVGPSYFDSTISFQVIIMVVIGGIGTIYGGIAGAFIVVFLIQLYVRNVFTGGGYDILFFGVILVIVLLYLPHGIVRSSKNEKRAIVLGVVFALLWAIVSSINIFSLDIVSTLIILISSIFALPSYPVFFVSEQIGMFILKDVLGLALSGSDSIPKAKFLIDITVGIPFAYYLPKLVKYVRLRFWGTWPSVGIYEPDT